jgi:hypothetical protein
MRQPVLRIRIRSNPGPEYFFVIRLRIQLWIQFMDPEQYPELIVLLDVKMSPFNAIFQVVINQHLRKIFSLLWKQSDYQREINRIEIYRKILCSLLGHFLY